MHCQCCTLMHALQVDGAAAEVAARAAAAAQRTALRQWASSEADAPLVGIPEDEVRARLPCMLSTFS